MSINIVKEDGEGDLKALHEELEKRYGAAVAQGIIDQIKKTQGSDKIPGCMLVIACCDMRELFRGEAQALSRQLRTRRRTQGSTAPNITFLDKRKLEAEFRHIFRLYWVSMKLSYPLYARAEADYQGKIATFGKPPQTSCMAAAA